MDSAAHVSELVRSTDPDRYVATLYAPEDRRRSLLALYGFNTEISTVRERIREPMTGEIRLQWWRDIIGGPPEELTGNPVADELKEAIRRHMLPRPAFDGMLSARVFDLYDDPMPDRTSLEGYCGETASALIQLASLVLDPGAATGHAQLAGHAGCAQAMTGILKALPVHRRRGQCYVPQDLLAAAGQTAEEFVSGETGEAHSRSVAAMIALAREHLQEFHRAAGRLPETLRPAYLPIAPLGLYLEKISVRADPVGEVTVSAVRRHWAMLRRAVAGWP